MNCEINYQLIKFLERYKITFNHIRENVDRALLKSSMGIAQPKRHMAVVKCTKMISKCGIFLVFGVQWNLIIAGVAIKQVVISMASQSFHHLINFWQSMHTLHPN